MGTCTASDSRQGRGIKVISRSEATFFGVFLVRDGEITQGALIAAVILGGRAMAPMGQLANVLSRANGAKAAYKSLNDLFNIKQTNLDEVFSISRGNLSGTVEFRNVSYSYSPDAQPIIENLNIYFIQV